MSDFTNYLRKTALGFQGSEEEKLCGELLFTEIDVQLGDKRLNNIAAYTYNATTCSKLFIMIERGLSPTDNPWKTIYKTLLLLHTIVLYGSELAIDKAIEQSRFILPLQTYNSALVKKGFFGGGSGTDYGAPVRASAKVLDEILRTDQTIRKARAEAREGQDSLVPMGDLLGTDDSAAEHNREFNPSAGISMNYGQGITTSVGAGYGLNVVPGIYEGRPERYFDADSERRKLLVPTGTKDSQITRDAQAPSLLDMAFDNVGTGLNNLPPADYLPALEKQRELEAQVLKQQEQLKQLQELQAQQQKLQELQKLQQQSQLQFPYTPAAPSPVPLSMTMPGYAPGGMPAQMGGMGPPNMQNTQYGQYGQQYNSGSNLAGMAGMQGSMGGIAAAQAPSPSYLAPYSGAPSPVLGAHVGGGGYPQPPGMGMPLQQGMPQQGTPQQGMPQQGMYGGQFGGPQPGMQYGVYGGQTSPAQNNLAQNMAHNMSAPLQMQGPPLPQGQYGAGAGVGAQYPGPAGAGGTGSAGVAGGMQYMGGMQPQQSSPGIGYPQQSMQPGPGAPAQMGQHMGQQYGSPGQQQGGQYIGGQGGMQGGNQGGMYGQPPLGMQPQMQLQQKQPMQAPPGGTPMYGSYGAPQPVGGTMMNTIGHMGAPAPPQPQSAMPDLLDMASLTSSTSSISMHSPPPPAPYVPQSMPSTASPPMPISDVPMRAPPPVPTSMPTGPPPPIPPRAPY